MFYSAYDFSLLDRNNYKTAEKDRYVLNKKQQRKKKLVKQ